MIMTPQARPYVVRWRDDDGNEHDEHVVAYDLMEALQSASVGIVARGQHIETTVSVAPDVEALEAMRSDEDVRKGLEFARALGKTREQ